MRRAVLNFAISSVAAAVQMAGNTVKEARIVLGGVAPIPWRVPEAEKYLVGKALTKEISTASLERSNSFI